MPIGTNKSYRGNSFGMLNPSRSGRAYKYGLTPPAYSSNGPLVYRAKDLGPDLVITKFRLSGTNDGLWHWPICATQTVIAYYQDFSLSQVPYDYFISTNGHKSTATIYFATLILVQ